MSESETTRNNSRLKTAIVLGAPRSGTSMTAGILAILGVDMGNVRNADPLNPQGYYEDRDFLNLGDDIFRAADPDSNGFCPPEASAIREVKGEFEGRITALVSERNTACNQAAWGWKTTQTCLLADLFLPHVTNPHFVVALRNPLGSAKSAIRYVQHDIKKHMYEELTLVSALRTIGRYEEATYQLLDRHPDIPHLILAYEDIVSDPVSASRSLASFLALPVDKTALDNAVEFVQTRNKGGRPRWWKRLTALPVHG